MQKIMITFISAIGLLLSLMGQAQGTLFVSNLGQTPTGSISIGSDAWAAGNFRTGTNADGYDLNSVQLLMNAASGSPSGFNVWLYSNLSGTPYNNLGILVGSDPSAGGIFTYTASSLGLLPSTLYFVVVTAATPVAQAAYTWSAAFGNSSGSGDGWNINGYYDSSADGLSWQISRQYTCQLAIYATAVPEPQTVTVAALSLLGLSLWKRKSR